MPREVAWLLQDSTWMSFECSNGELVFSGYVLGYPGMMVFFFLIFHCLETWVPWRVEIKYVEDPITCNIGRLQFLS